jgi:beta-lactamase class A
VPARLTRRAFIGAAALVPLAACSKEEAPPAPGPSARKTPPARRKDHAAQLRRLERRYDARLGLYALATGTGSAIAHRADERFAFCSAFKGLAAAAVLHRNPLSHLDTLVRYAPADLLPNATITPRHVDTGMTIRALCDAAVRHSDGTAGNLLLRDLGGPAALTAYARSLGDDVTRMDRIEPYITEATPGDPRDTTSPRALGTDYLKIVAGDALPRAKRAFLRDLMERNATDAGAARIRAGLPDGWTVADKTGTGSYGTIVDVGIAWPPRAAPLLISVMARRADRDAESDSALIADAARYVAGSLA